MWLRTLKLAASIIGTNAAPPDCAWSTVDSTAVTSIPVSAERPRVRFLCLANIPTAVRVTTQTHMLRAERRVRPFRRR
jgi:hypothetical protein